MLGRSLLVAAACIVAAATYIAAGSACSGVRSTDKVRGTGGAGGTTMTGQPVGDSGVCFGDPGDPCAVCRCENCGALTAACETDTACVAAESGFNRCAQTVPGTDAVSLAPCRDAANTSNAKAGPYLDCLIASCTDKCL
jgi:hypothetical protein